MMAVPCCVTPIVDLVSDSFYISVLTCLFPSPNENIRHQCVKIFSRTQKNNTKNNIV